MKDNDSISPSAALQAALAAVRAAERTPITLESHDSLIERNTRRTAEAAEDINAQCAALRHDLDAERTERRSADAENLQYAEKWNRRNLIISLLALIVGIAALLVAVLDALGLTAF